MRKRGERVSGKEEEVATAEGEGVSKREKGWWKIERERTSLTT